MPQLAIDKDGSLIPIKRGKPFTDFETASTIYDRIFLLCPRPVPDLRRRITIGRVGFPSTSLITRKKDIKGTRNNIRIITRGIGKEYVRGTKGTGSPLGRKPSHTWADIVLDADSLTPVLSRLITLMAGGLGNIGIGGMVTFCTTGRWLRIAQENISSSVPTVIGLRSMREARIKVTSTELHSASPGDK